MSAFQIQDDGSVTITKGAHTYTVSRHGAGFRVYVVNPAVEAWNRGFAIGKDFPNIEAVEGHYKGLRGIAGAFGPAVTVSYVEAPAP